MHRTRGKVLGVAVAIAATGLLSACGDNDSTATSTPTLKPTTTTSAQAAAPTSPAESGHEGHETTPAPAPEQAPPPAETVAPERPEPVPTNEVPPADTSNLTEKDRKFLDALKAQGITPSSPDIALSIGSYVCQGVAAGASEQDLTTFVNAMAGSDPSFDPAKMPVEQAGQIYIQTAKQNYCQ
ncbi:Protein of unknown function [Nocardia amikacinitolerans]|uniref:DUF732 domain-containing protein n=1 Tax=Nocardia amikacinitolerans TaxID=756689 RepID=A0A285LQE9_9NOCA|nr:DUF732 domain-containing protein [Nocardia amikacinitolerans]MCP2276877.1 Protein of unknown function (DUF732) [Nocardia amikacinitolerans]MCP2294742.1 Protein of unknown function (DUF732) [Nocardia amikacinitolerans]MCP2318446.1 Protein of unknown function (DUF732) [Nocardia amikacinitolerans]SNY87170.1 Protein of unknown function [Nocardia amikacinitolerans]